MPKFSITSGNIIIPNVKLTSVVVTCFVPSPNSRPYWCIIHSASSSGRHLVDFVAIVRNANHPQICSNNANVRPRCIHLCSFSLRVCPSSSNIDKCVTLECPKCLPIAQNTRTLVFPLQNTTYPEEALVHLSLTGSQQPPYWVPKTTIGDPQCSQIM